MPKPAIKPPAGYAVGDRIKTSATYALVNPRAPGPRYGVITNGSHSCDGPVLIMLDGDKYARGMTLNLFEVIHAKGEADV